VALTYTVQRIQLTIDSMLRGQTSDVETGELAITPMPNAAASSTAKSSTAATRHPVFERAKGIVKRAANAMTTTITKAERSRARRERKLKKRREKEAAKEPARQQAAEADPEYIVISSDDEDDTDDETTRGRPELPLDQDRIIPSIEISPMTAGTPAVRRSTRLNGQERVQYEPLDQWRVRFKDQGHALVVWTKQGEPFLTLRSKVESQRFLQRLFTAGESIDAWTGEPGLPRRLSEMEVRAFVETGNLPD
jgi:hypothetical protein